MQIIDTIYQQSSGYPEDPNMNGNNMNMILNGKNSPQCSSLDTDTLSFHEYQQKVLSRVEALICSRDPIVPTLTRYCVPSSSYSSTHDDDL